MNFWKLSTFALTACLAATAVYATAREAHADPQPRMRSALGLLESAKAQLEAADNDKGGHRVKAIVAAKEAIEQTKKGIEADDRR